MRRLLIIPAAGTGSRLKADGPKLLVPVRGRSMLGHLIGLYQPWVDRVVVVVHPGVEERVRGHVASLTDCAIHVDLAFQNEPTGMLDAILAGGRAVRGFTPDRIWITWCDQIGVHPATLARMAALEEADSSTALLLPTAAGPAPYVHLLRDATGRIVRILHEREGDVMPADGESEIGVFSLSARAYLRDLSDFARAAGIGTATRERNFLPFIPWLATRSGVSTFPCHDPTEAVGINTPEDLKLVEAYLARRDGSAESSPPDRHP
jgi:bifunctional N-acetylglucosamine-1-phosphate-uridyltransferase/glucosamine-1-phosphate-acetyltransferase GlmU-like protein